jgi:hypothetical protein
LGRKPQQISGRLTRMDNVWIETIPSVTGSHSWIPADTLVVKDSADTVWSPSVGTDSGGYAFANVVSTPPVFALALLETVAQACAVARQTGAAVIVSWRGGESGGWRTETVEARQARL